MIFFPLAEAAFETQQSSTGGNVAVFVIDMRNCAEE